MNQNPFAVLEKLDSEEALTEAQNTCNNLETQTEPHDGTSTGAHFDRFCNKTQTEPHNGTSTGAHFNRFYNKTQTEPHDGTSTGAHFDRFCNEPHPKDCAIQLTGDPQQVALCQNEQKFGQPCNFHPLAFLYGHGRGSPCKCAHFITPWCYDEKHGRICRHLLPPPGHPYIACPFLHRRPQVPPIMYTIPQWQQVPQMPQKPVYQPPHSEPREASQSNCPSLYNRKNIKTPVCELKHPRVHAGVLLSGKNDSIDVAQRTPLTIGSFIGSNKINNRKLETDGTANVTQQLEALDISNAEQATDANQPASNVDDNKPQRVKAVRHFDVPLPGICRK